MYGALLETCALLAEEDELDRIDPQFCLNDSLVVARALGLSCHLKVEVDASCFVLQSEPRQMTNLASDGTSVLASMIGPSLDDFYPRHLDGLCVSLVVGSALGISNSHCRVLAVASAAGFVDNYLVPDFTCR
jgi:hypothetical protein